MHKKGIYIVWSSSISTGWWFTKRRISKPQWFPLRRSLSPTLAAPPPSSLGDMCKDKESPQYLVLKNSRDYIWERLRAEGDRDTSLKRLAHKLTGSKLHHAGSNSRMPGLYREEFNWLTWELVLEGQRLRKTHWEQKHWWAHFFYLFVCFASPPSGWYSARRCQICHSV